MNYYTIQRIWFKFIRSLQNKVTKNVRWLYSLTSACECKHQAMFRSNGIALIMPSLTLFSVINIMCAKRKFLHSLHSMQVVMILKRESCPLCDKNLLLAPLTQIVKCLPYILQCFSTGGLMFNVRHRIF